MVSVLRNLNVGQILKGNFIKREHPRNNDMVHQRVLKEKEEWNDSLEQSQILQMEYITLELGSLVLFSLCCSPLLWILLQSLGAVVFFFHQSIRFQTYRRYVCINKNHAHRTLWKVIQHISSMPPHSRAKIVLAKLMNYGTSKSGEFVNLTTCRLQPS